MTRNAFDISRSQYKEVRSGIEQRLRANKNFAVEIQSVKVQNLAFMHARSLAM